MPLINSNSIAPEEEKNTKQEEVKILLKKAQDQKYSHPDLSLKNAQKALLLASKEQSVSEQIEAELLIIHNIINYGNIDIALRKLQGLCKTVFELDYEKFKFQVLNFLGVTYLQLTKCKESLTYFAQALKYVNKDKDAVILHINMGNAYTNCDQYEKAIDSFLQAEQINNKKLHDEYFEAMIYLSFACVYHSLENYTKAEDLLEKCLSILTTQSKNHNNTLRAYSWLSKCYVAQNKNREAIEILGIGYQFAIENQAQLMACALKSKLGKVQLKENYVEEGLKKLSESFIECFRFKDHYAAIDILFHKADYYVQQENFEQAKIFLLTALDIVEKELEKDAFKYYINIYALLADICEKTGELREAIAYLKLKSETQAKLFKNEKEILEGFVNSKINIQQKETEIEQLKKENEYNSLLLKKSGEIERANQRLQVAIEELKQFAYIASHDLKTPLRVIYSFAQLLKRELKDKENIGEDAFTYMKFISEGADNMTQILDDLLFYSTLNNEDYKKEDIPVFSILESIEYLLANEIKEGQAIIDYPEKLPAIRMSRQEMTQLFQNIISNGIKFRKPDVRPHIDINYRLTGDKDDNNQEHLFIISDNGIGIEEKYHKKVFTLFKKLHSKQEYKGTGIGLSICQKIVQNYNGKIWIESAAGKGTRIFVSLPV